MWVLQNDGCLVTQKWSSSSLHTSPSSSEPSQPQLSGSAALEKVENSFLVGIKNCLGENAGLFSRDVGSYWATRSLNLMWSPSALSDPLFLFLLHCTHSFCTSSVLPYWAFLYPGLLQWCEGNSWLSLLVWWVKDTELRIHISSERCISRESSARNQWVIQNPFQRKYRKKC